MSSKKINKSTILIIAMLMTLALVFTGCGGSPDKDAADTGTGTATGAGTESETQNTPDASSDADAQTSDAAAPGGDANAANTAAPTPAGKDIVIPVSEITDQARFYPTETEDGTVVEVLALTAPDGTIRTAFNTCQVCNGSGRGYYVQDDDVLVCQNCGNRFDASMVEIESGGCNPVPIFEENKTVTEETITISAGLIAQAKEIFTNWKV